MHFSWLLPTACLALCGGMYLWRRHRHLQFMAASEGDEDIKIAPGSFSGIRSTEDAAEQAAREFLRQKESGNIDRARELGSLYAQTLLDIAQDAGEQEAENAQIQRHRHLLCSYGINRVIADHSPDSILAQTTLNVFYSDIENQSPELYKHISDMAAFSLYILCERSSKRSDEEIGLIFARLCGREGDARLAAYGNALYSKIYADCLRQINDVAYR